MKKVISFAICLCGLAACYTPLNNSGVATTKPWLEVSGNKTDFNGKQYDSCSQFKLRFWPPEAVEKLDLQDACISTCCWSSDKETVTLDLNKNFETDLAVYGRARKYTPDTITLRTHYANWLNTMRVTVSPRGVITNDGLVKLTYQEYENPTRLAQLAEQARQQAQRRQAQLMKQNQAQETAPVSTVTQPKNTTAKPASSTKQSTIPTAPETQNMLAKSLVQHKAGTKIDMYFYKMDKQYKKQGAFFLLSERLLYTQPAENDSFIVSCVAKARTGLDAAHLQSSTFSCGQWLADLSAQTVTPYDKRAQLIWDDSPLQ